MDIYDILKKALKIGGVSGTALFAGEGCINQTPQDTQKLNPLAIHGEIAPGEDKKVEHTPNFNKNLEEKIDGNGFKPILSDTLEFDKIKNYEIGGQTYTIEAYHNPGANLIHLKMYMKEKNVSLDEAFDALCGTFIQISSNSGIALNSKIKERQEIALGNGLFLRIIKLYLQTEPREINAIKPKDLEEYTRKEEEMKRKGIMPKEDSSEVVTEEPHAIIQIGRYVR